MSNTLTSARAGVAVVGDAVVGVSDMPDSTGDRFTWEGSCWELVSDPDLDTALVRPGGSGAAQDAFAARLANILHLNVGNLVVTEGATINHLVALAIAGATAEFQQAFIQNLRSNGAVIDEAVIGDLAAMIITSGLFRTAAAGQRLEIDSSGMVMFGVDPDGNDYEMVRIGPSGDNLITLGDTTVSPSGIQAPSGVFDDISIGGDDLSTILDAYPRGIIAFAHTAVASAWHGDGSEIRRLEVNATVRPGRRYRVTLDQHFVELRSSTSTASWLGRLKYGPSGSMSTFAYARTILDATSLAQTVPALVGYIETSTLTGEADWTIGYTTQGPSGRDIRILGSSEARLRLTVEDLGPTLASTGEVMMNSGTAVEGTQPAPTPDPPKVKRYTKTYTSTGYRCYNVDDRSDAGRPDVVHGLYAGGPSRFNRMGGWTFPSMTGDLSGATVEKIEMYIRCNQTYASAGSTVNPAVWGSVMANTLSPFTSVSKWKAGQGKWIPLPSSLYAGFKSGTYAGVGVKPTSTSTSQYARFDPTGAQIKITYVK